LTLEREKNGRMTDQRKSLETNIELLQRENSTYLNRITYLEMENRNLRKQIDEQKNYIIEIETKNM